VGSTAVPVEVAMPRLPEGCAVDDDAVVVESSAFERRRSR